MTQPIRSYHFAQAGVAAVMRLLLPLLLCSCSPKVLPVQASTVDSVRVEVRERIDTVSIVVEKEVIKVETLDTTSTLVNTWATSTATVSKGALSHSLESIPQVIRVPVEVHDTVTVQTHTEAQTITVEVEKPLSGWQKFWMTLGMIFAGIIIGALVFTLIKIIWKH